MRAVGHCSHRDAVEAFRATTHLDDAERAALMGGTLQRVFGWTPG